MGVARATVRILGLLILALSLVGMSPAALSVLLGLVAGWLILRQRELAAVVASRVLRLRWFFLAIFILYLLGAAEPGSPQAWLAAAYRVGVLVALVCAVTLALNDLPAAELAAAIARGLRPLQIVGFPVQSFARRLAGTLDAVAHMDERVRAAAKLQRQAGIQAIAGICADAEAFELPVASLQITWPQAENRDFIVLLLSTAVLLILQFVP